MKTIAGQIKIRRPLRPIQVTQNVRDPAHLIGTDLARVPLVEVFQAPVPERPYRQNTVPCIGTHIKEKMMLGGERTVRL